MATSRLTGARVVLALVAVLSTGLQVLRARAAIGSDDQIVPPGLDFHTLVWAPTRGLLAGFNPYQTPADPQYLAEFGAALPSSPRPPFVLLLTGPLAIPPVLVGYLWSVALGCLLMWAGMVLLAAPATSRHTLRLAGLGAAVVVSGPSDMMLGLGQVTPWLVLGLGLLMRARRQWLRAAGLALTLVVPQFGAALSLLLLALGRWRLVLVGGVLAVLTSLPALVPAVLAAGGAVRFVDGILANVALQSTPANAVNRVDLGGLLAGSGWMSAVPAVVLVAGAVWLLARCRPPLDLPLLLGMSAAIMVAVYHMPYHLPALLAVAAALLAREEGSAAVRVMAGALVVTGLLTSFALVPVWESATGLGAVVWSLLLVSLSVVPAVTAVLALGAVAVHRPSDPAPPVSSTSATSP